MLINKLVPGSTLIVFSTSDSSKVSSWSNVPYLFTETLKGNGINIIRVTITEILVFNFGVRFFKKGIKILFGVETSWEYSRSALHFYLTRRKMNATCKKYAHDSVLILNCSYAPTKNISGKLILFCDWPYDYYLSHFLNKKPDMLEAASIKREHFVIKKADFLFVLFPGVHEYVENNLKRTGSFYLGNVINSLETSSERDIAKKESNNRLIFIGKSHYKAGAEQLIRAFELIKAKINDIQLDIIGMSASDFANLPQGVNCHGYLDKGNQTQRVLYYSLLRNAKLYVNTTSKWASFSAALEALYFYTPIITSKYSEVNNTFGDISKFGSYFEADDVSGLAILIENLLNSHEYRYLALNSNRAVEKFSWDNYVKAFLQTINYN